MYSLRMSFWTVPRSWSPPDALLLGDQLVEQEQAATAGALIVIDVETSSSGMPSKSELHVGERVDRDAGPPHLAARRARSSES